MSASKDAVATFLKEFKSVVTDGRGLDVVPRRINRDALIDLGLTERNRRREILSLSVQDYSSGPDPDNDRPGELWVFGRIVDGREVYIKLKVAEVDGEKLAKCLSFHSAEYAITYPFKSS